MSLSDDQKEYIEKKVSKIIHYSGRAADESTRATVDMENEKIQDKQNHIRCVVNIFVPGATLHAENYAPTIEAAIDGCEPKLKHQIDKYKAKMQQ